MHASDSFYSDMGGDQFKSQAYRVLPSNEGRELKVESKLFVYLKRLESLAKIHGSEIDLYNLSNSAAKIEGIPYVDSQKMANRFSGESRERISQGIEKSKAAIRDASDVRGKLAESLNRLAPFAKSVCSLALQSAVELKAALKSGSNELEKRGSICLKNASRARKALREES